MRDRYELKTFIWGTLALISGVILASYLNLIPSSKVISSFAEAKEVKGSSTGTVIEIPSFVELAKELKPAVVNISTTKVIQKKRRRGFSPFESPFDERSPFRDFFDRFFEDMIPENFKQSSLGSGFIIDKDGYILTNNHVIEGADEIKVRLSDGKEFDAEIKGRDAKTDLALIKIKSWKNLPKAKLGDSDKLEVGEWVVAIGNPFGLDHTVTAGIVSAKGRIIGAGPYDNFIQTDASINPGNSGGPLFNLNGEVIGINTAIIASGQGIGFAIPINMAKKLIPQLKEKGKVTRGWLGVVIQKITPELAESFGLKEAKGALVADVVEGGPAHEAGIRQGDVIMEVNGKDIDEMNVLPRLVANLAVGEKAKVKVIRNGAEKTVVVTIGEFPEKDVITAQEEAGDELGMTVQDLTPEIAKQFGYTGEKGVLVTRVLPGTPAAEAGIKRGDLIKEINRKPVKDIQSYEAIFNTSKDNSFLLLIRRGNSASYVVLKLPEKK
ncbi:MAG: DegQ family serine endoprotease [Thermodesulfobacteriota bacterium]|nr:DegQ family serine endoprotease [Thermodesulfobacteriota bacterium]